MSENETTPKSETAWAVLKPNGKIILHSIRQLRKDAIMEACYEFSGWMGQGPGHWNLLRKDGFTFRKIRIEVDGWMVK